MNFLCQYFKDYSITDRQTDRQTYRHTDRCDREHYNAAFVRTAASSFSWNWNYFQSRWKDPPYLPVEGPHVCSGASCYVWGKFSGRAQMYETAVVL